MMRMMMNTGRIHVRRAVAGANLAMATTIMMARVRRTRRALSKGPGKRWDQRTGRGKVSGRAKETVKGKVL